MTTESGAATVAVWLRPKTFTFSGVGVAAGDRVKYVPYTGDCSAVVDYMMDPVANVTVEFYELDETLSIETYFLEESTEEEPYQICYQFQGQEWMNYGPQGAYGSDSAFKLVVFGRPVVTASSGDKDVFVKDVPKTLTYSGILITPSDRIKVVEGSDCSVAAVAAQFDDMVLGDSLSLTFNFADASYLTREMTMCFRFADDSTYVTLYGISVKTLTSAAFTSGHPQVLVAGQVTHLWIALRPAEERA